MPESQSSESVVREFWRLMASNDFASVKAAILAVKPRLVLNAAAYTAVDRAETEPKAASATNAWGAVTVARAAALQQVPVIQISTDYVFDGTKILYQPSYSNPGSAASAIVGTSGNNLIRSRVVTARAINRPPLTRFIVGSTGAVMYWVRPLIVSLIASGVPR